MGVLWAERLCVWVFLYIYFILFIHLFFGEGCVGGVGLFGWEEFWGRDGFYNCRVGEDGEEWKS